MQQSTTLQRVITFSVLPVGLLLGTMGILYAYWYAKASLGETVGTTFQELARQSAENVGLLLTKEVEWIEQLSALPMVRAAARESTRVTFDAPDLKRVREQQQRYFTSMVIMNQQGQPIGDAISNTTTAHYRRQAWWAEVFEGGHPWGGPIYRDEAGRWYWEIAVPIKEASGAVVGALKVVIGREQFLDSVLRGRIGRTGHVMLLDERGTVVACTLLAPSLHTPIHGLRGNAAAGQSTAFSSAVSGEVDVDTHQGIGGIVGLAPVSLRPDILLQDRWSLLVQQDPAEMYSPLLTLAERLALFGIIAIGLIALLWWRLARRIAQPINALMRRMRTMSVPDGSCHQVAPDPVGVEEIDALAASFEQLTARLSLAAYESQRHIHKLEEANREIARSEEYYRMVWNHSLDLKLLVDSNGIVRDLNRRGEIKLWQPAAHLLNTPMYSLFRIEDQPRLRALLTEVFATGKERPAGEWHVPAPAGDFFVMEVDLVPLVKDGQVETVMVQLTDLTETQQLQEQLIRSERLASLSQFASMFAHDIRNPLAGVKKTLELMAQRAELQVDPVRRWCEDLHYTIEQLQGMINDMLDVYQENYSGLPLITSSVCLNDLIHEVLHLLRLEAEAREITFDLHLPEEGVMLEADRRRLERVLINLVHNALKYSPPRGLITLSIGNGSGKCPAQVTDATEWNEDHVSISIEDEGPGIEPDVLPHIFEMFFRPQRQQDWRVGRGLGLYFCHLVVKGHHGVIRASNRRDGGAQFCVELPAGRASHVHHITHC